MKTGHASYSCRRNFFVSTKFCCASLLLTGWISGQGAPITWTNTAGGDWSNPNNWCPNQVPGATNIALMTEPGNYTVTVSDNESVCSLILGGSNGTHTLNLAGGTFTINGSVTENVRGVFDLNGGVLAGNGVITGTMNWTSGKLGAGATLTVATNGVLNMGGSGTLQLFGR